MNGREAIFKLLGFCLLLISGGYSLYVPVLDFPMYGTVEAPVHIYQAQKNTAYIQAGKNKLEQAALLLNNNIEELVQEEPRPPGKSANEAGNRTKSICFPSWGYAPGKLQLLNYQPSINLLPIYLKIQSLRL